MSRTLSIKHGSRGAGDWASGWHLVTIHSAKYGDWEGNKFLNLTFKDYPENFNLRLYAKIGTNGEEFVIGNLFRFANAGIEEVLDDGSVDTTVVKINDDPHNLVGKEINVLFFKKGEYTEIYSSIAPTVFKNAAESFTEDDVQYWKGKAEKRFALYNPQQLGRGNHSDTTDGKVMAVTADGSLQEEDLPF